MNNKQKKRMWMTKCFMQNHVLISILLVITLRPVAMEAASESDRLERLERAVEQLQMRNVELEAEVRSLKKETAAVPDGKFKTKVNYDGKTYVEQAVPAPEKPPLFVQQRGPELKLVLGGYVQINFEDGDAHRGDHTGAAGRCSALGKTLREHLA